ncbi:hypothetical protein WJ542_13680 [Paraburkholderia sp. B3]|jgi:hypothetical protein|uniref:hypothetical protein n=1 Tax=Paraburkholderia sp. B3 TaxID=3134791 RepID=UPI0039829B18
MKKPWTVVRFPSGSWSYGGKPDDPDYVRCEIWQIEAETSSPAVGLAQARRSRERKRQERSNGAWIVCLTR